MLTPTAILRPLSVLLSWLIFCATGAHAETPIGPMIGLPDGHYLIERTQPATHMFRTKAEADEWIKAHGADFEHEPPVVDYHELWIRGDEFIARMMEADGHGGYVSANRCFVGVSSSKAWAFEEFASRVTTIDATITSDSADKLGGPVNGLIAYGFELSNGLRSMGFDTVNWRRANAELSATAKTGEELTVVVREPSANWDTEFQCLPRNADDFGFLFREKQSKSGVPEVTIEGGPRGQSRFLCSYRVLRKDELETGLDFGEFWRAYSSPTTSLFMYDPKADAIFYRDLAGALQTVLGYPRKEKPNQPTEPAPSAAHQ
jgi:hypothetical protein